MVARGRIHLRPRHNKVILCERGIRTLFFEPACRGTTLDLSAVPSQKKETHLPVFVDPSHAAGPADMIIPLARAARGRRRRRFARRSSSRPSHPLSDGGQQLKPKQFEQLMSELKPLSK